MAKSLRSKWKRKMKAVKRVRYGEKVTEEDLPSRKDGFMMIGILVYWYTESQLQNLFATTYLWRGYVIM